MTLLIDPASGWMYGFPKPYTKPDDQSLKDWLIENGYPKNLAQQVADNELWCRFIGTHEELIARRDREDEQVLQEAGAGIV